MESFIQPIRCVNGATIRRDFYAMSRWSLNGHLRFGFSCERLSVLRLGKDVMRHSAVLSTPASPSAILAVRICRLCFAPVVPVPGLRAGTGLGILCG
jgi:hypothetical protein